MASRKQTSTKGRKVVPIRKGTKVAMSAQAKAWETRRANGDPSASAKKAWATRNAATKAASRKVTRKPVTRKARKSA